MSPASVARLFSGGVAIYYVLPVLLMTPCCTYGQEWATRKRRVLKMTRQVAACIVRLTHQGEAPECDVYTAFSVIAESSSKISHSKICLMLCGGNVCVCRQSGVRELPQAMQRTGHQTAGRSFFSPEVLHMQRYSMSASPSHIVYSFCTGVNFTA